MQKPVAKLYPCMHPSLSRIPTRNERNICHGVSPGLNLSHSRSARYHATPPAGTPDTKRAAKTAANGKPSGASPGVGRQLSFLLPLDDDEAGGLRAVRRARDTIHPVTHTHTQAHIHTLEIWEAWKRRRRDPMRTAAAADDDDNAPSDDADDGPPPCGLFLWPTPEPAARSQRLGLSLPPSLCLFPSLSAMSGGILGFSISLSPGCPISVACTFPWFRSV